MKLNFSLIAFVHSEANHALMNEHKTFQKVQFNPEIYQEFVKEIEPLLVAGRNPLQDSVSFKFNTAVREIDIEQEPYLTLSQVLVYTDMGVILLDLDLPLLRNED